MKLFKYAALLVVPLCVASTAQAQKIYVVDYNGGNSGGSVSSHNLDGSGGTQLVTGTGVYGLASMAAAG